MPIGTEAERRALLVRSKARKFAAMVRDQNMAFSIPEDVFDWLKDDEIEPFKDCCKQFRIVQRPDLRWERA